MYVYKQDAGVPPLFMCRFCVCIYSRMRLVDKGVRKKRGVVL